MKKLPILTPSLCLFAASVALMGAFLVDSSIAPIAKTEATMRTVNGSAVDYSVQRVAMQTDMLGTFLLMAATALVVIATIIIFRSLTQKGKK